MGGKFFDSSYRESSVKNKAKRQGAIDEPRQKKAPRKKTKDFRLMILEADVWGYFFRGNNGCWEMFPCKEFTPTWGWYVLGRSTG